MIPSYLVVRYLGLINSVWALILPGAVPIGSVILVMNFFRSVPKSLEESALLDGANPWQILTRIYIPISLPSLATVSLFSIVGSWNDFFGGLIYITKVENYPLMTYIQSLSVNIAETLQKAGGMSTQQLQALLSVSNRNLNAAKIVVAIVPLLVIYPFLQKYFVQGIVKREMNEFFKLDNVFFRVMNKCWNYLVLNFMILLTSLPVVTIGASQIAAHTVSIQLIEYTDTNVTRVFFRAFKSNFKKGTIVWIIQLMVAVLLCINGYYLMHIDGNLFVLMGTIFLTLIWIQIFQWGYYWIARYEGDLKQQLIASFKTGIAFPLENTVALFWLLIPVLIAGLSTTFFIFILYMSLFLVLSICQIQRTKQLLKVSRTLEQNT